MAIRVSVMELSFLSRDANGSERPSARLSLASLREWPTFRTSSVLVTRRQAKGANTLTTMSSHTQTLLKKLAIHFTNEAEETEDCLVAVRWVQGVAVQNVRVEERAKRDDENNNLLPTAFCQRLRPSVEQHCA